MQAEVGQDIGLPAADTAPADTVGQIDPGGVLILRLAEEPHQRSADVASAGNCGEVVEALEKVGLRQPLQNPECERGGPDAAAGEGKTD